MVQIICDTWKEAKGFIMQYPELIGQVMLKSEGRNIIDIYDPHHTKDWTTRISQEELIQIVNSIENVLEPSIKTGSNDVYKELLSDQRWIDKSNEIKRRDFYTCTRCYNSIVLNDIIQLKEYLLKGNNRTEYVENIKTFNTICRKWTPTPSILNKDIPEYEYGFKYESSKIVPIKEQCMRKMRSSIISHGYIPSLKLYLYEYNYYIHTTPFLIKETVKTIKGIFFSNQLLSTNESMWYWGPYNDEVKDYYNKKRTLYWQYSENGNTNDKFVLSHCVSEEGDYYHGAYRGIGILSYNQYSIIFPLYQLNTVNLEVHHKVYKKKNGEYIKPWEYENDELETLCYSCHQQKHIEENIKIIHNNHF
ncbi:HNH endonuclease [Bacteroides sp. ET71]|uniref:HNH endonuclease n=1 Tax=Bacteroides sp. ET71 TaxID=2939421 RepID=UPI0020122C0A|nr:HNH endonuclease [Bacteroides sp. ET71]MCL1615974.1 HNH endonuclease [Bacteroides sp. ET71]